MKPFLPKYRGRFSPRKDPGLTEDLSKTRFVVLDTETTGFDPISDRILSIGALKLQQGRIRVQDSLELYLYQDRFDRRSVPIHGILREDDHERIPEKAALEQLHTYLKDSILVGHHIRFDLEMLRQAHLRHGMPALENPYLDTGILFRHTLLKSPLVPKKEFYTLDELIEKYELSCKDRHTALGDAYLTAMIFLHILSQLRSKNELSLKQLLKMGT
jgi:DNA polymerase-3 subunit epsilon